MERQEKRNLSECIVSYGNNRRIENTFARTEWLNEDFREFRVGVDLSGNESMAAAIRCIHKRRAECLN